MKNLILLFSCYLLLFVVSCDNKSNKEFSADTQLDYAVKQLDSLRVNSIKLGNIPRSTNEDGSLHWLINGDEWESLTHMGIAFDWTEGFFPGTCWYLYEYTHDEKWKDCAERLMQHYRTHTSYTASHDLGFVFQPSYGKGYELTKNEDYKEAIIEASNSLIARFYPEVGCIKSWNGDIGWQAPRGWQCPVIIDNMLNLEMLFEASILTGDSIYRKVAVSHANTTMKNHFREDFSSFHVVDYDPITGNVRAKETAQGFAATSAWSRGQGWGIYGYTMCYRYTKDKRYLDQAEKIAAFILSHKNLPEDKIPYWDFDCPDIPNTYRDASAGAVIASALIELDEYAPNKGYFETAKDILTSLSSDRYLAKINENNNFLLMHNVGSIPHNLEIDKPINYGDYYYVEALLRAKKYMQQN